MQMDNPDVIRTIESMLCLADVATWRTVCVGIRDACGLWTITHARMQCLEFVHRTHETPPHPCRCLVANCNHHPLTHVIWSGAPDDEPPIPYIPYCEEHVDAELLSHVAVFCYFNGFDQDRVQTPPHDVNEA